MSSSRAAVQYFHSEFTAMGSPCEIRLYRSNRDQAASLIQIAKREIARLEQKYSRYIPGNELYRVNQVARAGGVTSVDNEFLALLQYADTCYEQSQGLFDITSGVLRQLWDFSKPENVRVPEEETLADVLTKVGWHQVAIKGNQVSFCRAGMELDLGGIVKEYAADLVANLLFAQGVQSGLVNLGGDIKAIGPHPDGSPWQVKIRSPQDKDSRESASAGVDYLTDICIYREGLATSGDYERCTIIDGKRYSHLLSPKTGWPVQGLASVTVIAPQCVVAGSAATIALLQGSEGRQWLTELGLAYYAV